MENNTDKTTKKFNSRMQASLLLVFCVIAILMFGLIGRLVYIMQTDGDRYAKTVLSRQSYVSSVLPYKRGDIVDRNGTVLAHSELQFRLILDPKRLLSNEKYIKPTINALTKYFGISSDEINAILKHKDKKERHYIIVRKNLKYDIVDKFKEKEIKKDKVDGVYFEEEYFRTYPYKSLASDVLGFTSGDNRGIWGIENYYNDELNGTNGREYGYYGSDLNIERIVKKAVDGNTIVTTIDADVQRIVQKKINEFNAETGAKNVSVLVMNPNNGDIIAMASGKDYDLNDPRKLDSVYAKNQIDALTDEQKQDARNAMWRNDIISDGIEPGSTWKPMTISAGLEENLIKPSDHYFCDGSQTINGVRIYCSHRQGHGDLNLTQALMFSCNDALMQIGAKEGKDVFYKYEKNFGLGQKTGIDLPGEFVGIITPYDRLGPIDLATSSFGQTFKATMIQMAAAFSSIVNGGNYYVPHVMKQIINENGATVKDYDKLLVRQTVSEKTSEFLKESLYQTVEAGTAKGAKVEGYAIGGKTGTAQKLPREAKTYIVSFLGCVPAMNPEMVIYVAIDEPQNVPKQANSGIATEFAGKILKEILPVLGLYPEGEIDYLLPTKAPTPTPVPKGDIVDEGNVLDNNSEDQDAGKNNDDKAENKPTNKPTSKPTSKPEANTGNKTANNTGDNTGDNTGNNTDSDTGNNPGNTPEKPKN